MTQDEGTYSALMELERVTARNKATPRASSEATKTVPPPSPNDANEDLSTTPYISQNYRFTEDELRWLRRQAYNLSERLGTKVSQNTVLRVALHFLREACTKSPRHNPLFDIVSRIKK